MNSDTDLSWSHSAYCPACRALIPAYLGQIVAERDREKLSRIFVTMVGDVFQTEKVTLFRHLKHRGDYFVVPRVSIVIVKECDNPTDLIDRADKALYQAKQTGRNFESLESAGLLHRGVARKTSDVELF